MNEETNEQEHAEEYDFFRAMSREKVKEIRQSSLASLNSMAEDEQLMAFIMEEHPEFKTYWDNIDEFIDYDFDPETEINPFMHVQIHQIVETQIRQEKPPEVERIFQALKDKGVDRHEALHMIGSVFVEHMFDVLQGRQEFDQAKYLADLKKMLAEA
jgi:hypothetical protein